MKARDFTPIQTQIWYELERSKGPLSKELVCQRINCSIQTFNEEKKALLKTGELYFCQEGYILKDYATYDQQLWHLSWALGLMEMSSQQVVVDEDLLRLAPQAIATLIDQGKMDIKQNRRLNELKTKLATAMEAPKLLLQTYNKINTIIDNHLEPKAVGDGKTKLTDLKDLKKFKNSFNEE